MSKIKSFFKEGSSVTLLVALGLLVAGGASAALISVYVTMNGSGDVDQSVVFGDDSIEKSYTIGNSPAIAGNTYTQNYNLKNRSVTTAPVKFQTNQCIVGGGACGYDKHDEEGVETSYWSSVELRRKDNNWGVIDPNTTAMLSYELAAEKFNYEFEANGLEAGNDYSLIYYADYSYREDNWGGDNPGALIAEFTADQKGNISETGSKNLKMNLPHADDWNSSQEANYCDSDGYELCRGAKVWLVPSKYYDSDDNKLDTDNWNSYRSDILFETDLITYDDTDTDGVALNLGEGQLNFFVKNELNVALQPGEYKVDTKVLPVY